MKKLLLFTALLGLLLAGCGDAAAAQDSTSEAARSATETAAESEATERTPGRDRQDRGERPAMDENAVMGKVTTISDSEITLELATMSLPERGDGDTGGPGGGHPAEGSMPDGSAPELPGDGEQPAAPAGGDAPTGGDGRPGGGGRGGNGPGSGMGGTLEYTGESGVYILAADVEIRAGSPDRDSTESVAIAAGDIVRLALNDDEQVTAITVITGSISGPAASASESEATA